MSMQSFEHGNAQGHTGPSLHSKRSVLRLSVNESNVFFINNL